MSTIRARLGSRSWALPRPISRAHSADHQLVAQPSSHTTQQAKVQPPTTTTVAPKSLRQQQLQRSTRFGSNVTVSIIHGAHKVYVGSAISHGVTPSTTSDDNTYEGRLPSEGQHEEEGQGAAVDDRQAMSDTSNGLTDRAQLVSVAKIVVPEMSSVGPDITASTKLDVRQSSESLHSDRVSHEEPGATIEFLNTSCSKNTLWRETNEAGKEMAPIIITAAIELQRNGEIGVCIPIP
ncbi:hypothetical protein V6N12_069357 [Hibiscus sabdariffa]|uniref:Uncharacterized protein n=1 Tax=Hibiscus sabdariffa TaxID=183260 RepID=A0ABR2FDS4_9ROSI